MKIQYNLRVSDEVKIYEKLIRQSDLTDTQMEGKIRDNNNLHA